MAYVDLNPVCAKMTNNKKMGCPAFCQHLYQINKLLNRHLLCYFFNFKLIFLGVLYKEGSCNFMKSELFPNFLMVKYSVITILM